MGQSLLHKYADAFLGSIRANTTAFDKPSAFEHFFVGRDHEV